MKTRLLVGAIVATLFAVTANAQSEARPGTIADLTPPGAQSFSPRALLTESFDSVQTAATPPAADGSCTINMPGWVARNRSTTLGTTCVFQGNPTVFTAQAGATNSYAGMNFNSTTGTNTISTWLLTPVVNFTANSALDFWVRGGTGNTFPDRVQVRVSTAGAGTDVGANATAVGTFTTLLLDINPTYAGDFACPAAGVTNVSTITGFPNAGWCRVRLTGAAGGLPTTGSGRIAFRYFVESGGPTGANSNFVGIDSFSFEDGVVPVTTVPPIGSNVTVAATGTTINFSSQGATPTTVNFTVPPGFTVTPSPLTIPANGSAAITVGIAPGTPPGPIAGTLVAQGVGSFNLSAVVPNAAPVVGTPVNTLSTYGLGLLGLMLAGVGIVAVRRYA